MAETFEATVTWDEYAETWVARIPSVYGSPMTAEGMTEREALDNLQDKLDKATVKSKRLSRMRKKAQVKRESPFRMPKEKEEDPFRMPKDKNETPRYRP